MTTKRRDFLRNIALGIAGLFVPKIIQEDAQPHFELVTPTLVSNGIVDISDFEPHVKFCPLPILEAFVAQISEQLANKNS